MALSEKQLQEIKQAEREIHAKRAALGVQIAPDNALLSKLKASRRLSVATVETFDIKPYKFASQWGWAYPIQSGGQRWKNANSNAALKYAWIPSKPDNAMFYHAPIY